MTPPFLKSITPLFYDKNCINIYVLKEGIGVIGNDFNVLTFENVVVIVLIYTPSLL